MRQIFNRLYYFFGALIFLALPKIASALVQEPFGSGNPLQRLEKLAPLAGYDTPMQPGEIAGQVIGIFIGLLGIIFISLIVFAGYDYMVARGEEEKVSKALGIIRRSIIGLVIIISAYVIWSFIFRRLTGS